MAGANDDGVSPKIARLWSGKTHLARPDEYEDYLRSTGVAELSGTPGNMGVFLLRRDKPPETEFLILSLWENVESIQRFAGDEVERAVYYPADKEFLIRMDPTVSHFQIRPNRVP
jgi:heme-degrading monooxygenase HmoA